MGQPPSDNEINSGEHYPVDDLAEAVFENATRVRAYVGSQSFSRVVSLTLSVISHGMANLAHSAMPVGDRALIERATTFEKYLWSGSIPEERPKTQTSPRKY